MSALIASAAIGAVGAGYKIYQGISQNSAANKLQRGLVRPMYPIQQQYYQNQGLAENQAQEGLSAPALSYYGDQANRGLSAGISGILQGGGDVNNIASLYDKYNQGNRAVAVQDSALKNDNIRYLVDRNKDLAGQETQQWALNKYEPYKDTATAITGLRNAGGQNVAGGIGELGSVASIYATGNNKTSDVKPTTTATPAVNTNAGTGGQMVDSPVSQVMQNYQNSPYYNQLNAYMNQPLSA
jgi:hypothetical protein